MIGTTAATGKTFGDVPRDAQRLSITADIYLRKSGYQKSGVVLLDVSPIGCRVELPERVAQGQAVWVTLPGLQPIEARVAWVHNWESGLRFIDPIHSAVFDALVLRMKQ
jgi:hypothetical protein